MLKKAVGFGLAFDGLGGRLNEIELYVSQGLEMGLFPLLWKKSNWMKANVTHGKTAAILRSARMYKMEQAYFVAWKMFTLVCSDLVLE